MSGLSSRFPRCWAQGLLPFRLEILTPVFVGSGENISPLDYVIRPEGANYALHLVDGDGWLQNHCGDAAVRSALESGNMWRLRTRLADSPDALDYSLARIPINLQNIGKELSDRIRRPQSNSKAEIQTWMRSPVSQCPILPGSSLKGAISTPLIDDLDIRNGRILRQDYDRALKFMFGQIPEHAMQALKVADIAIPPGKTRLVAAREIKRNPQNKKTTPKPPCEALPPAGKQDLPIYGSLRLDCRSGVPAVELPDGTRYSRQELGQLCADFYGQRFKDEGKKFYTLPHLAAVRKQLDSVSKRVEGLDPDHDWLLRLGRYSHLECVTVTDNRPQHKKGHGTTRTLADGQLPFGWVILHFCDPEEYETGLRAVEQAIQAHQQELEQRRATRMQKWEQRLRQAEETRRQQAAEALQRKKKEEETQAREAALAALPPQEQKLARLGFPNATDDQAQALFRDLDTLEPELRQKAARALKDFWQKNGKWQGKTLSKKQRPKVAKIAAILGEA